SEKRPPGDERPDAGCRDDKPGATFRSLGAAVPPIALIVDGHESALFLSDRVRENVLESRNAGTKMTHLHTLGCREREQLAGPPVSRHEYAHDVFVGRVTIEPRRLQTSEKRVELSSWRLDSKLKHAAARLLQRVDRPLGGNAAVVHDDDVVADVFDIRQ